MKSRTGIADGCHFLLLINGWDDLAQRRGGFEGFSVATECEVHLSSGRHFKTPQCVHTPFCDILLIHFQQDITSAYSCLLGRAALHYSCD